MECRGHSSDLASRAEELATAWGFRVPAGTIARLAARPDDEDVIMCLSNEGSESTGGNAAFSGGAPSFWPTPLFTLGDDHAYEVSNGTNLVATLMAEYIREQAAVGDFFNRAATASIIYQLREVNHDFKTVMSTLSVPFFGRLDWYLQTTVEFRRIHLPLRVYKPNIIDVPDKYFFGDNLDDVATAIQVEWRFHRCVKAEHFEYTLLWKIRQAAVDAMIRVSVYRHLVNTGCVHWIRFKPGRVEQARWRADFKSLKFSPAMATIMDPGHGHRGPWA